GSSWRSVTTTTSIRAFSFPTSTTGYACGGAGRVIKTTDGGTTWTEQTTGTDAMLNRIVFPVNTEVGYACGTQGTVIKTTDGGTTWMRLHDLPVRDAQFLAMAFPVDNSTGYLVGDMGMMLKTTDGGAGFELTYTPPRIRQASIRCKPNPVTAGQSLLLSYEYCKPGSAILQVLDISGRVISQYPLNVNHEDGCIPLRVRGLAKGIYLIRLESGRNTLTTKVVIQ
ncbi:MAG: YCF48-related protein, partial [candidate division WOR-3 bacterium]